MKFRADEYNPKRYCYVSELARCPVTGKVSWSYKLNDDQISQNDNT
jgi:hypothetical protein